MKKYHWDYLGDKSATDVMAFEMKTDNILGDVLISSDTARRQARQCKHSFLKEIKTLAIHGVLHLIGYKDKRSSDQKKMWAKTDALLALIERM